MQTVVLNADYTFLNTVNWKRAINLLLKEKAIALKESERCIKTAENALTIKVPIVLRLVNMVKTVYRNKVPYSRRSVIVRDDSVCQYCGSTTNKLSVDHIIPVSKGGTTSFNNCVACCIPCNVYKDDRTPEEARMRLLKTPHEPTVMEFLLYKVKHEGINQFLRELNVY